MHTSVEAIKKVSMSYLPSSCWKHIYFDAVIIRILVCSDTDTRIHADTKIS